MKGTTTELKNEEKVADSYMVKVAICVTSCFLGLRRTE